MTPRTAAAMAPGFPTTAVTLLWTWLVALVVARAIVAGIPTMWDWSVNLHRFLHPWVAWGLWALSAVALIPWLADRATPALKSAGDWIAQHSSLSLVAVGLAAFVTLLLLPDRVGFVGDFMLREGTLRENVGPQEWYPQAMPLDLMIHAHAARVLMTGLGWSPNAVGRAIGAAEAALLAMLAIRFARALDLRGAVAVAASVVVFWGGYLTLLTGYNKAFSEMAVMTAAVGVFGLETARKGRGFLGLGVALTLALLIHRSALGLLPAAAVAFLLGVRGRKLSPSGWIGVGLPLAILVLVTPRIVGIIARTDAMHFTPEEVRAQGFVAGTFAGARIADLANLLIMLSPLGLALPLIARFPTPEARREGLFLGALMIPFVAIMPFIHPGQGYFRDWDDFAAAGAALSIAVAWAVGGTLERAPRAAWLTVAVCLGVVVPSLQWLQHHTDLGRGMARVTAFMNESPTRTRMERYTTWEFVGSRYAGKQRFDEAADAYSHAAEALASPHILHQWAATEMGRGRYSSAGAIYRRILSANPKDVFAWWALSIAASRLGDWATAYRATSRVLDLDSSHVAARQALLELNRAHPGLEAGAGSPR